MTAVFNINLIYCDLCKHLISIHTLFWLLTNINSTLSYRKLHLTTYTSHIQRLKSYSFVLPFFHHRRPSFTDRRHRVPRVLHPQGGGCDRQYSRSALQPRRLPRARRLQALKILRRRREIFQARAHDTVWNWWAHTLCLS